MPEEQTTTFNKLQLKAGESHFQNISIRGWLALIITITGCVNVLSSMVIPGVVVDREYIMLWLSVLSYYFGKATTPTPNTTVK